MTRMPSEVLENRPFLQLSSRLVEFELLALPLTDIAECDGNPVAEPHHRLVYPLRGNSWRGQVRFRVEFTRINHVHIRIEEPAGADRREQLANQTANGDIPGDCQESLGRGVHVDEPEVDDRLRYCISLMS